MPQKKIGVREAIGVLKKTAKKEDAERFKQEIIDEKQQLEIDRQKSELDLFRSELDEIHNELIRNVSIHKWRKVGLIALFLLVVAWLVVICLFLFYSGYSPGNSPVLQLSDAVIVALIGSTTVNVVGLFYIAARWLYSTPKPDKNS